MRAGIRLVCFDLDETLIAQNSWYELNKALGISDTEDAVMLNWYQEGILSYGEWIGLIEKQYKKRQLATRQHVQQAIREYIYAPGARKLVRHIQEQGYEVALISGSIDILVDEVARELGIAYSAANNLFVFGEDDLLEEIVCFNNDALAKLRHLQSICRQLGITMDQCACVGDGDNDRELFLKTGKGITFVGSPLEDIAWKVVPDLSKIKELL